ncbi:MAG TPA: UvrB/UvrC motif-containing protein [Phycisphaerae bacterium]|nr:UvrB/UvrC motif-containing protein [Phycisphaerae bacterium]
MSCKTDLDRFFDGVCQVQPPVAEEQLAVIPPKRGVALLLAQGGRPIVLLPAADLRSRVRLRLQEPLSDQRTKTADLREITREIRWTLAYSHFETDLAYLHAACSLWPRTFTSLLAWKPPWFVHVQPGEEFPRFQKTRKDFALPGWLLGPFPSGQAADRFIETIQDAFDLCRDYRCLRQAPHGQPCAYGQMGKCLSPCDGRISMDRYREVMAQAANFAAGDRQEPLDRLRQEMMQAAGKLQFERAAALKARLGRLDELHHADYAHLAPLDDFRFVLVQRGAGRRKARAFLADRGLVQDAGDLDYPLRRPQVDRLLKKMARLVARGDRERIEGDLAAWRMGLVAHYLFTSPDRRGVILRWEESLQPADVEQAIDDAARELHLSRKQPPKGQGPDAGPS